MSEDDNLKVRKVPVVPAWEFYKNSLRILENPLIFHRKKFEKLGDTFRLKIGPGSSVIFSRNAAFAQYALQKNQKNFSKTTIQTRDMAKYLGQGLLTSEGEHWKKQRKLIQPAFHKKKLVLLLESIKSAISTELNKIETGKSIDIFPIFNDLAFQTVVKSLFSSAVGQKEINRLQYITEAAQRMLVKELRQPYLGWWFTFSGKIKEHIDLTNEARDILRMLIDERRTSGERQDDLLDMLLEARYDDGSSMENEQLIDEILILFTAGHETTSNALTFTAQLLSRHPEAQEKILEEVKKAERDTNTIIEFIQACSYTKMVLEEAMRLYPPAYFIDRVNNEDDVFDGMMIPKGSSLLFSMYEIHRHKDFWNEPEEFRPDRFEDPKKYSSCYYPFGAGPRMCIGNNFAMYEMILAVAQLVSRYRIKHKEDPIEITPLITLKPKNAVLEFYPQ
ncbi:cytochrome P450 [Antarcticibacterium flavum]|uniref:Cytochrome P450 n=1 Tax=Antarcticibacterium flavum TaxID=2058175 RepID=A0A5B7X3P6_9FLAO|nr:MULTISPECIES: cytochrome P450 [Antarcticibacterium]MCM4158352.1 cytochrome P450 [Antarcticibacterium sp. W02-3]QCY70116.1 cytochrome P450 [Antarcticibacterium flavum]